MGQRRGVITISLWQMEVLCVIMEVIINIQKLNTCLDFKKAELFLSISRLVLYNVENALPLVVCLCVCPNVRRTSCYNFHALFLLVDTSSDRFIE